MKLNKIKCRKVSYTYHRYEGVFPAMSASAILFALGPHLVKNKPSLLLLRTTFFWTESVTEVGKPLLGQRKVIPNRMRPAEPKTQRQKPFLKRHFLRNIDFLGSLSLGSQRCESTPAMGTAAQDMSSSRSYPALGNLGNRFSCAYF